MATQLQMSRPNACRSLHESRFDVGDQPLSRGSDAVGHPGRDRAAAAADLKAVPARADTGRLQETEGAKVVEAVEAREALRGFGLRGVVENVGFHGLRAPEGAERALERTCSLAGC